MLRIRLDQEPNMKPQRQSECSTCIARLPVFVRNIGENRKRRDQDWNIDQFTPFSQFQDIVLKTIYSHLSKKPYLLTRLNGNHYRAQLKLEINSTTIIYGCDCHTKQNTFPWQSTLNHLFSNNMLDCVYQVQNKVILIFSPT